MKKSLYDILAVPPDATVEQILAAYQEAISKLDSEESIAHDPNKKIILREAFHVISHPQRRASYDASLAKQAIDREARESVRQQTVSKTAAKKRKSWLLPLAATAILLLGAAEWWSVRHYPAKEKNTDLATSSTANPPAITATASTSAGQAVNPVNQSAAGADTAKSAEEIYAQLSPSVALISVFNASGNQVAIGSGVVIAPEVVITNCHVTKAGVQYRAKIGKDDYPATVVMADEEFDLCRLSVPGATAPVVSMGSSEALRIGQKVYALGAPQGLDLTISDGIVSALRPLSSGKVIQTTAPISPGSSGGGLFDASGKLVGIMTFQHKFGQNLNFAVPADWINAMRARTSTSLGVGALTIKGNESQPNPDNTPPPTAAQQAYAKIFGTWLCYGVLTGYSIEINFGRQNRMTGTLDGKKFTGNFYFDVKAQSLSISDIASGKVDEFTDNKLVVNAGKGARLVCNRK
ncbi:trypsin-like peptidase domain-containing protein [Undibacterium sp. TJN19]|uniref:trypsin-like peptidase domain-containing protein n=1 Tax=Undibacterium sp. TJN19 TaxID=3413055 RepID=UPI003BF18621